MTSSTDLQREVLERMAELGHGRTLSASTIAHHGEPRSVTAVWRTLELLWEEGLVVWTAQDRYRLPARPAHAAATHDQMTIGER